MQKQPRRHQVEDFHKASPTMLGFIVVRQGFRGSRDLLSNRWRDEAISIDGWAC